jgi:peptide/nickel transport system ATP-binding protein
MRFRLNALLGAPIVAGLVGIAVLAAFWTPYSPTATRIRSRLQPPSSTHWLGTDEFGRDVLSRLMDGALVSFRVAFATMVFAIVVGTLVGIVSGFLRGWPDRLMMMVNDALLAFPGILLALALMVILGPGQASIVLALGTAYTPSVVRVVRGQVLSLREREFIEASRMIGNADGYTMLRHVLPNCAAPISVLATSMFGWAVLSESALSFLGLGVPAARRDLGQHAIRRAGLHGNRRLALDCAGPMHRAHPARGEPARGLASRSARPADDHPMTTLPTPSPLLAVEGLRIETTAGHSVVRDLSFDVRRGEFLAVVGESGSGKTMAARAVLRLLPAGLRQTAGRVTLDGQAISDLDREGMRALRGPGIGMVFQEPMVSLNPAMTIGTQMAEGLVLHRGLSPREVRERSVAMLGRVGIGDPERCLKAYPHEFSGGMRQRIMLASVMLLKPKLLIADEPTTALDTLTQREVLDLMVELARDEGTAVLLITHNLGLVARYTQRAIVLEKGLLVESGETRAILGRPREAYTKALIAALPRRAEAPPRPRSGTPLLSVRDLVVSHAGALSLFRRRQPKRAVDGVSFDVHPGEVVAVVGGSGSGKTTLGRALLRLIPAQGGTVLFDGQDILRAPAAARQAYRLAAQLVFQDPYSSLDPRMRVDAIVKEPLRHITGMGEADQRRRGGGDPRRGGLGRLWRALSPPALGRPAPAGRHRARAGATAPFRRGRRARLCSRHDDPGSGPAHAEEPPGGAWLCLPLHLARSGDGRADRRPGRRDAGRADRRGGSPRRDFRSPSRSLYPGAPRRSPACRAPGRPYRPPTIADRIDPMTFEDYADLDAVGLAEAIRTGAVTAEEAIEAAIARMDAVNPVINAVVHRTEPLARKRVRQGVGSGPFAGVPFLVKDLSLAVRGTAQTNGSRFFEGYVAEADSTLAERIAAAGLVVIGRTATPEFGLSPVTEPRATGPCRNPWNPGRQTGGSSGGRQLRSRPALCPWPTPRTGADPSACRPPIAACSA